MFSWESSVPSKKARMKSGNKSKWDNVWAIGILSVSFVICWYMWWIAGGPAKGDIRKVETENSFTVQKVEYRWGLRNEWFDYVVTPKNAEETGKYVSPRKRAD